MLKALIISALFFIFIIYFKTMKTYFSILVSILFFAISCNSNKNYTASNNKPKLESDTIRIANDEIEYEVLIIDPGFTSWFNSFAKPRGYHSQSYMENRNRFWVLEWNRRANLPFQYNPNLYETQINYDSNINYGYEVNYMIYNYLVYFQLTNKQQLGGYPARF